VQSRARLAGVSRIVKLTQPDFKRLARRFLRWRAKKFLRRSRTSIRQILADALGCAVSITTTLEVSCLLATFTTHRRSKHFRR
jgi:hypothetical protein